ncbi:transcription factor S [Candidatus Parvarchaeota archaeon]|nr:MAG: transcription factor S [Candidatus Parvarchaeota archaeon]
MVLQFNSDGSMKTPKSVSEKVDNTNKAKKVEVVSEKQSTTNPVVEIDCVSCKHGKSYFWTMQTRSGDESETKFYKCLKCNHTWRVYK